MLYDPNWKPDTFPTEGPSIEPWQKILLEVADVIKKRGWVTGDFQINHRVCAIGAFRVVQHGDGDKRHSRNPKYDPADLELAKRKFFAAIPNERKTVAEYGMPHLLRYSSASIQRWNDSRCRSKAEIIGYLRKAAHVDA